MKSKRLIINNKALYTRIPETLLNDSQETAKSVNMHHSQFVREAIEEKIERVKGGEG